MPATLRVAFSTLVQYRIKRLAGHGFASRRFLAGTVDFRSGVSYAWLNILEATGGIMEWTAPAFEEVCLNCEINSYASATL
jgi:coenzyme PQQ precursor peptide PqqA